RDDAPLEIAALVGCAVSTGVGAVWNTAQVRPGERVAVLGCGGVGLSVVLGARLAGASPIVAVDISDDKLEHASELGATETVAWAGSAEATADAIRAVSNGGGDYPFEEPGRPGGGRGPFLLP